MEKIILTCIFSVLAVMLGAEDIQTKTINEQLNYFAKNNPKIDAIPYWENKISFEAIADNRKETNLEISSYVFALINQYASAANTPFSQTNPSENFLTSHKYVAENTNFLLILNSGLLIKENNNLDKTLNYDYKIDLSRNELINSIFDSKIEQINKGCAGRWKIDDNHIISGFVLILDSNDTIENQKKCIDYLLPFSFGVTPSSIEFPFIDKTTGKTTFTIKNNLETDFRLQAATGCREKYQDRTESCATSLVQGVRKSYGNIN